MIFRNALKILISRFSLVWNVLLYSFIVISVLTGICITILFPFIRAVRLLPETAAFLASFEGFILGTSSLGDVFSNTSALYQGIVATLSGYSANIIFTLIIVFVVGRFLVGLVELPLSVCIHDRMTANARTGFAGTFFANLGKSAVYQLSKIAFTLPFDIIVMLITYFTMAMLGGGLALLMPMFIFLEFIAFTSFKSVLFCTWQSFIIEGDKIYPALRKSLKLNFANFHRIFSYMIVLSVLSLTFIVLTGLLTWGAGFLVSIPMIAVLHEIMCMTIYMTYQSRRYYADSQTVITPPIQVQPDETID